jgi:uncharacterized lipoprotein YmbA
MQLTRSNQFLVFKILRSAFLLVLGAVAAFALNGCALLRPHADPTRFYVLTVPGTPLKPAVGGEFKRWRVGLRLVEVPSYLRTKFMVVRTGSNEIHFADFDRWAEPLEQGISRVLKETLGSAQNVQSVALNSHGDASLDYEVTIQILACHGMRVPTGKSSIRFAATWEVQAVGTNSIEIKRGSFTADAADWDGNNYSQLATQLSAAVAVAGKTLAADLPMESRVSSKPNSE